jgi:DNA-binding transcriptional ArsR family regulator
VFVNCYLRFCVHILHVMDGMLRLNLPWLPDSPGRIGDLAVMRGRDDVLTFDDGISLHVVVLDPASCTSAGDLVAAAREEAGPGRVVLVAGAVPVDWRAALRSAEVSFLDAGGVAEIAWPRLRVASRQFTRQVVRRRDAVPLQKGHALVAQELLAATVNEVPVTISELARCAGVSASTASRAVARLAEHGLAERTRNWRAASVRVADVAGLAALLAARTAWPGPEVVSGYAWGRTIWDVAATMSRNASDAGIPMSVTGRAGAAFLGVLGISSPAQVRCWVTVNEQALTEIAERLGLEPAPPESVNVCLSADPWRIGTHRRAVQDFDGMTAAVAHPLRVWCDLHGEERGDEFAAQLWGTISHAR